MRNGMCERGRGFALVGRPTVFDVGIGVLYFFTSHMVIRTMYYVGVDRSLAELSTFFLIVVCAVTLAHLVAKPLLRARLFIESSFGVPAVSMAAAVGAVLALVSMLPVVGVGLFWASGALLGLACGWMTVIWTSTIRASRPDPDSFFVDPSLAVAVAVYFLFRLVSTFSDAVAQGFLLALPLAAFACIVQAGRGEDGSAVIVGERAQALRVLVVVAAVFAVGCSAMAYLSGREDGVLSSGLNYMALFEALAVLAMVFCSGLMGRFAREGSALSAWGTAVLTLCVCVAPLFCIGLVMGGAGIPDRSPDALWETSVWVLIVAIFAYDIRTSPYAVKGLAVGVMFEAMCVGQLVVRVSTFGGGCLLSPCLGVGLTLLYFASVCRHVLGGGRAEKARSKKGGAVREPGAGDVANAGDVGDAEGALPEALRADAEATRASGAVRTLGPTANGAALGTLGATDASDAANGATARAAAEAAGAAVGKAARAGGSGRGEARSDGYGGTRGDGCRAVAESDDAERSGASQGDGVPAEILACCQKLAFENGLTRREVEILGLIAMGRSAKYIADELHISYNTTRTHIRHVYEKLNIHAKQELIDLVLFGSNLR